MVVLGLIIGVFGLVNVGFDFSELNMSKIKTVTYEVEGPFAGISIEESVCDVYLKRSEDESCRVVCNEYEKTPHSVTVKDNVLVIEEQDQRKWYDHIGIFWGEVNVTVYLPQDTYEKLCIEMDTGDVEILDAFSFATLEIDTDTGDVELDGLTATDLSVSTDTGDVDMCDVTAKDLLISTDTGDMELYSVRCESLCTESDTGEQELEDVIVNSTARLKSSTGDIDLLSFDADEIFIKASTGDVFGILLSEKKFDVDSSTGDIRVPQDGDGGLCEIRTSTGDIEMKIQ